MKLVRRNCACGCPLWFRVLPGSPQVYGSQLCQYRVEGDPHDRRKWERFGIDRAQRETFLERITELLKAGLRHREIVSRLIAEGIKTPAGMTPSLASVGSHIKRLKSGRHQKSAQPLGPLKWGKKRKGKA